jgi:orotidine-5'-phosphate decarboxylase
VAKELDYAVILDAKRGDVGSTAEAYAQAYLSPAHAGGTDLEVDCLTVNPFLGPETMEPFVARARDFGKGLFVLVKTSNPESGWLQDQRLNGGSVSDLVARLVAGWAEATIGTSGVGAVGAVVGATYPEQASRLRKLMPRSTFLAPGLGAQGGEASALSSLATKTGPVLVSASRGIASVEDPDMPIETYKALVRNRIVAYAAAAKPQGQTGA